MLCLSHSGVASINIRTSTSTLLMGRTILCIILLAPWTQHHEGIQPAVKHTCFQITWYRCCTTGVRFSGCPVTNGTQKWLRATSMFDYGGLHDDLKYLRSCNISDEAKIKEMLINISEVLSWLYCIYVNHKSCVYDTFDIVRNFAKP